MFKRLILVFALCCSLPIVAAEEATLSNAGFETGEKSPDNWIPFPLSELGKSLTYVSDAGIEKSKAAGISDCNSNCGWLQTVKAEEGKTYEMSVMANCTTQSEFSLLPEIKIIMLDKDGNWIGADKGKHAVKISKIKATDGWQEQKVVFITEKDTASLKIMFNGMKGFKGSVLFDSVKIALQGGKQDAGNWLNRIYGDVVTPHVAWAKPLYGGAVSVFALVTVQGKRELVELQERLELNSQAVVAFSPSALGFPSTDPGAISWPGSSEVQKICEIREKLKGEYQVYIVGNVAWELLPIEIRHEIFRRASEGAGLVFVMEQPVKTQELAMLEKHPSDENRDFLLNLPQSVMRVGMLEKNLFKPSKQTLPEIVQTCRIGKGRAVLINYPYPKEMRHQNLFWGAYGGTSLTPWINYNAGNFYTYEYYQQLLIRAILVAANRVSESRLEISRKECDFSPTTEIPVRISGKQPSAGAILKYDILSVAGAKIAEGSCAAGDRITLSPGLPAGSYIVNLRLFAADGKVMDFLSSELNVRGTEKIESLAVNRSDANKLRLTGKIGVTAQPGRKIKLTLTDIYRRIILEKIILASNGENAFDYEIPIGLLAAKLHELKAQLIDGEGHALAQTTVLLPVPLGRTKDIDYVVWSSLFNGAPTSFFMASHAKQKFGFDFYEAGAYGAITQSFSQPDGASSTLDSGTMLCLTVDQSTVPYVIPVLYSGKEIVRKPCLNDPSYRKFFKRVVESGIRYYYENGVKAGYYMLGDEFLLAYPGGPDVCFSQYCQDDFRLWLQKKYGSLEKLNSVWKTKYAKWDEVSPVTLEEAKRNGQRARWLDHRLHMDAVIADLLKCAKEIVTAIDPGGKVGFEGMFRSYSECGYDMEAVTEMCDVLVSYEYSYRWEMLGSFAKPGDRYGVFSNTFGKSSADASYQVWKVVMHGLNEVWYWRLDGQTGFMGPDLGVGARPDYYEGVVEQSSIIKEANDGIAAMLQSSVRTGRRIAILHSQDNLHASKYQEDAGTLSGDWSAFQFLFEDLGCGYRYLKTSDLLKGLCSPENTSVLVLPYNMVVSDEAAAAIRKYVQDGGAVMADVFPAMLDAHGNYCGRGGLDDLFGISREKEGSLKTVVTKLGKLHLDDTVKTSEAKGLSTQDGIPYGLGRNYGKGKAFLLNFPVTDYGVDMAVNDFSMAQAKTKVAINAEIREYMRGILGGVGVRPVVGVNSPEGSITGLEIFGLCRENSRYLGLIQKSFGYDVSKNPVKYMLHLQGGKGHVYNVRKGEYLGFTDKVELDRIEPGAAVLLAQLPYRPAFERVEANVKPGTVEISGRLETAGAVKIHHVLQLTFTTPDGKSPDYLKRNLVLDKPVFSWTQPMELNAPHGEWCVTVKDVASSVKHVLKFNY